MSIKYCINCENSVDPNNSDPNYVSDFCSQECADEYACSADPELLNNARNINPDALPINDPEISRWAKPAHPYNYTRDSNNTDILKVTGGILPPNTTDAIASMLKIGGVSQTDIDKVLQADSQTKSQNETEPK